MSHRDEWSALVDQARTCDMLAVAAAHGAKLKRCGSEYVGPCPVCGGRDRFAINLGKGGVFLCRICCNSGRGPIDLEIFLGGSNFVEAVKRLTNTTSVDGAPKTIKSPDPKATIKHNNLVNLARADQIWRQSCDIAGTAGEAYLTGRGIALDEVPNFGGLRWHPRCPWEIGTTPCIVARFTDAVTGEPRGIWRRPIDGRKPKTLGPMGGCVIRLWPDEDVTTDLVLGEGVETTLAAATRFTHRNTLLRPAWAAGSVGNLENFPVLEGIEALTLLVDHDVKDKNGRQKGQQAARTCGKRWRDAKREVTLLIPRALGADFNDLVQP